MSIGFRAFAPDTTVPEEVIARFRELTVPSVADAMSGFGVMDRRIQSVYLPKETVAGRATTVQVTPGDGFMIRLAITTMRPGDVLVAAAGGEAERAVMGGNRIMDAAARGAQALVVDGMVRDRAEIEMSGLTVFCAGVTPRSGSTDLGRGEVNGPVACGGVVVFPGDVVVGDEDGVVVVPALEAEEVLERAFEIQARKGGRDDVEARMEQARSGQAGGLQRVVDVIKASGCEFRPHSWREWVQGSE